MITITDKPILSGLGLRLMTSQVVWKTSDKVISRKSLVLKGTNFEIGVAINPFAGWAHRKTRKDRRQGNLEAMEVKDDEPRN